MKIVMIICTVFVVSYVPTITQFIFGAVGIAEIQTRYHLFRQYTLSINLIANPFIYTMTQRRFKEFLQGMIKRSVMRRNDEIEMRVCEQEKIRRTWRTNTRENLYKIQFRESYNVVSRSRTFLRSCLHIILFSTDNKHHSAVIIR